ncbi:MAG: TIGR02530 family flagellar biosynthesis protein [Clostridiaceae bacterium]
MSFKIQHGQIIPSSVPQQKTKVQGNDFEKTFLEHLKQKKEPVKISAHALGRMDEREISLNEEDIRKINEAVNTLEKKGAKESLLLYKDIAFIASIQNRTIITAMKSKELDTVTNIDSTMNIR